MKKRSFLPIKEEDRNLWLKNFADKLPLYAAKYAIHTTEVQKVKLCAANFNYWLEYQYALQTFTKSVTTFRKSLNNDAGLALTIPQLPSLGNPPNLAPAGMIKFIMSVGHRIKKHIDYTPSDGYDLGLITNKKHNTIDIKQVKPTLELKRMEGGQVQVVWHKPDGIDALEIHVDRSDGKGYVLCDIDTKPNYTDHAPLPLQPAWWKYMAIYRVDDKIIGQWSDSCKIMVGKE